MRKPLKQSVIRCKQTNTLNFEIKGRTEKTKDELNKVNPVNLNITNVETRRNGKIIIQCESG